MIGKEKFYFKFFSFFKISTDMQGEDAVFHETYRTYCRREITGYFSAFRKRMK